MLVYSNLPFHLQTDEFIIKGGIFLIGNLILQSSSFRNFRLKLVTETTRQKKLCNSVKILFAVIVDYLNLSNDFVILGCILK